MLSTFTLLRNRFPELSHLEKLKLCTPPTLTTHSPLFPVPAATVLLSVSMSLTALDTSYK